MFPGLGWGLRMRASAGPVCLLDLLGRTANGNTPIPRALNYGMQCRAHEVLHGETSGCLWGLCIGPEGYSPIEINCLPQHRNQGTFKPPRFTPANPITRPFNHLLPLTFNHATGMWRPGRKTHRHKVLSALTILLVI